MSERIRRACGRYQIEMLASGVVYAGVLIGAKLSAKSIDEPATVLLLALAPIAPLAYGFYAFARYYFIMDERERRIAADAAALTLMFMIVSLLTIGFLRLFGVISFEPDLVLSAAGAILFWGLARIVIASRR
ncbi:MAG: hypothetical protein GC153_05235 [Alphaproteobacteria bacterium]|nr:hypothetical protein [Alphaproteobacteria bacterium]